jgi:recombination protein RecA
MGVDLGGRRIIKKDYGEQALQIVERLAASGAVALIIIDSVSALVPKAELDGEVGDHHVGAQARMMSQALRMLNGIAHKTGTAIIFINQLRMKIGVMFGSPETTSGGRALRFYSSLRLDVRKIGVLKNGTDAYANQTRVKVVKNKVGRPFRSALFEIDYNDGISRIGCLIDVAVETKVIRKSGGNHYWTGLQGDGKELKLGMSRNTTLEFLKENVDVFAQIEAEIYEAMHAEDEDKGGFDTEED